MDGYVTEVPLVETPVYLRYLMRRFDRLGGQVTAYGPGSAHCKVVGWNGDFDVDVRCFKPYGTPVDSRFNVLVLSEKPIVAN